MKTKTIYYAIQQEMQVPEDMVDEEIDELIFRQLKEPASYIWSEDPELLFD